MYVPVQAAPDKIHSHGTGGLCSTHGRQTDASRQPCGRRPVSSAAVRREVLLCRFREADEEIPTQAEPSKVAYELKPPVSEPPVRQSEAGSASLRPEPVMYKPEPTPAHVPAEQPVQDSPFAAQQGGNPLLPASRSRSRRRNKRMKGPKRLRKNLKKKRRAAGCSADCLVEKRTRKSTRQKNKITHSGRKHRPGAVGR